MSPHLAAAQVPVAVGPNTGAGATQTFSLIYQNAAGATDITKAWVWFSATFASTAAESCLVYYDQAAHRIYLLDDAGTTWNWAAPGDATQLQNSRCAINVAASAVAANRDLLTVHLAMRFKAAYSGGKNIYMYVANASGSDSGWHDRGDWSVPAPELTLTDAAPASGSGATQTFDLEYSSPFGGEDITQAWAWFNFGWAESAAHSCLVYYDQPSNKLLLLDDAGTLWQSETVGSSATLQNSQCAIVLDSTTVTSDSQGLTLSLPVTFASTFGGTKNIYLYGVAESGVNSGWQQRGEWTVPWPALGVAVDAVTPDAGTAANQAFELRYSSSLGYSDIVQAWVWFNATFAASSSNTCLIYYDQLLNQLLLLNDAGTGWLAATLGSAATLENSQCAVALGSSTVDGSGNQLTLNLAMTFKPAFTGVKNIYMYGAGAVGADSGWQQQGTWTLAVTADSASPNAGSGATQSFALQYSSSFGAADLTQAWVWFDETLAATSSNSCLIYYDQPSNELRLLDDAGSAWQAGTLGSGGTLENSQCAIALAGSTVDAVDRVLTLTLEMTFKPVYAGTKSIFMYAASSSAGNSGWVSRGGWTAP